MSPGSIAGGAQVTFQATVTNLTSPQHLGSANLTVPAGFSVVSASTPAGTATPSGNVVQLRALDIQPGASLTVTVVADVPCTAGTFTWSAPAKQDNDFSGPPGNDFGPLRDSSLTTSVSGACAAALRFVGQPAGAAVDQTITTSSPPGGPVTVEVIDGAGNRVTTSSAAVTMGIAPGGGTGALNGTTTVTAVNGLATFSDLSIDTRGTYALQATSPGLTSATSDTLSIDDVRQPCVEDLTCTATLSNTNVSLSVSAAGNPQTDAGFLVLNRGAGLDCAGYDELSNGDFSVDYLPNAGLTGRTKIVTATIDKQSMNELPQNGAAHLEMCFEAPFRFDVKPGSPPLQGPADGPFRGLLPDCGAFAPPCVSSRNKTQAGQGVIEVQAPGGVQDPRYSP